METNYPFQETLSNSSALFLNEARELVYSPPPDVRDVCNQLTNQGCRILSIQRKVCQRHSPSNGQYREVYGEEAWCVQYELPQNLWYRMKVAECWVFDMPVEIPDAIPHVDAEIC